MAVGLRRKAVGLRRKAVGLMKKAVGLMMQVDWMAVGLMRKDELELTTMSQGNLREKKRRLNTLGFWAGGVSVFNAFQA
jgi:hypothetical protein